MAGSRYYPPLLKNEYQISKFETNPKIKIKNEYSKLVLNEVEGLWNYPLGAMTF
jgi:hypothetical protein